MLFRIILVAQDAALCEEIYELPGSPTLSAYEEDDSVWEGDSDPDGDDWQPTSAQPEVSETLDEAVQPQRRREQAEYQPRRRAHGELRGDADCDLSGLWEPSLDERNHPPPSESLYKSLDAALQAATS